MSQKKLALFILLSLLSIGSGAVFGLLDLFGFIDGRHTLSFSLLLISIFDIYLITITVFLLNFAQQNRVVLFFIIASLLFSTTFFLMNLNILLTITSSIIFFIFLWCAYSTSRNRSQLFISFSPREIFFPVIKTSFLYFMVVLALLAYSQSKVLVSQNSLISPQMIKTISHPIVITLNKQLNAELKAQLGNQVSNKVPVQNQEQVIRLVLQESLESMQENGSQDIYGFKPKEIPIEKTIVYKNGDIDVAPVVDAMLPEIARRLNDRISQYAVFTPLIVAFLVLLILQPFVYPLELIESFITQIIFKIMLKTKFLLLKKEVREIDVLEL